MIKPDNPCYQCQAHRCSEVIKAPCCHDSVILVNSEEYTRLFLPHYLNHSIDVEESFHDGEMWFYIYLLGKCPFLDKNGLCSTEETKPLSCKTAQPREFKYCILPKK